MFEVSNGRGGPSFPRRVPKSQDYINAIHKSFAAFPGVCSAGVTDWMCLPDYGTAIRMGGRMEGLAYGAYRRAVSATGDTPLDRGAWKSVYGSGNTWSNAETTANVFGGLALAIPAGLMSGYEAAPLLYPLKVDGPSAGLAYGKGRVFGVRYGSFTLLRMDYHPMSPGQGSRLHLHVLSSGEHTGLRFPIWPGN